MRDTGAMAEPGWTFSEKSFYLAEFRGRSLGLVVPEPLSAEEIDALVAVLDEFSKNDTRIVVLSPHRVCVEALAGRVAGAEEADWVGGLWRRLQGEGRAGLALDPDGFVEHSGAIVLALRLARVVWLDARGALRRSSGARWSVMSAADLGELLEGDAEGLGARDRALLGQIRLLLEGGMPAVNLCSAAGLADELFTYAGSGTFFTRERYVDVRWLGIDDFDAAADLIARGVAEGYLVPRDEAGIERVLSHGFGVFVEGRYLAGIGALLPFSDAGSAEIAGLYTLTRFMGEGVGGQLIRFAADEAAKRGYDAVYACTTSDRVIDFFTRHGFAQVELESLPEEKWRRYAPERRARLRALRRTL
jgi:N-acetylglutamate synthase-like GNAT family acetyltransferase